MAGALYTILTPQKLERPGNRDLPYMEIQEQTTPSLSPSYRRRFREDNTMPFCTLVWTSTSTQNCTSQLMLKGGKKQAIELSLEFFLISDNILGRGPTFSCSRSRLQLTLFLLNQLYPFLTFSLIVPFLTSSAGDFAYNMESVSRKNILIIVCK